MDNKQFFKRLKTFILLTLPVFSIIYIPNFEQLLNSLASDQGTVIK